MVRSVAHTHLPHAPHDAELLCVDEALQHHPDGHVDVVLQNVVPQVHLGVCLGHADHRLDVADSDRDAASSLQSRTRTTGIKQRNPSGQRRPKHSPSGPKVNRLILNRSLSPLGNFSVER